MVLKNTDSDAQKSLWERLLRSSYFLSALEVMFALIVSNAAIFISMFVYMLTKDDSTSFQAAAYAVSGAIRTTEVVVYVLGFLAPAMWIMVSNIRAWRHVGFLVILLVVQLIVVGSTGLIFAFSNAKVHMNIDRAGSWAWWCLLVALIVWYVTLVYDKQVLRNLQSKIETPKPGRESGSRVLANLEAGK